MKLLALPAVLCGSLFLTPEIIRQEEPYAGDIIVFTQCRGTRAFYDPAQTIENNRQYFIDKHIRIFVDTREYKCGYLLAGENKSLYIDVKIDDAALIKTCEDFFFPKGPDPNRMIPYEMGVKK